MVSTSVSPVACTPLSIDLKIDEDRIVLVLMLLAEGCDISVLVRCSRHCEATITRWLERAGKHSSLLHNRIFRRFAVDPCSDG